MVFIEFVSTDKSRTNKHYFVGATVEDVLADTKGGKEFGFWNFSSRREITAGHARALNFEYFNDGVSAVEEGRSKSYLLGSKQT